MTGSPVIVSLCKKISILTIYNLAFRIQAANCIKKADQDAEIQDMNVLELVHGSDVLLAFQQSASLCYFLRPRCAWTLQLYIVRCKTLVTEMYCREFLLQQRGQLRSMRANTNSYIR